MSDPEKTDPWASLASELGLEPPPVSPEAGPHQAASLPEPTPVPPPPPKPAPRKAAERPRSAADWDLLAAELGIPPQLRPREPVLPAVAVGDEPPAPTVMPVPPAEAVEPEIREPSVFGEEAGGFAETVEVMEETTEFAERPAEAGEAAEGASEPEEQRSRRRRKRRRRGRRGDREETTHPEGSSPDLLLPESVEEPAAAGEESAAAATDAGEAAGAEPAEEDRSRRRRSRRRKKRRDEPGDAGARKAETAAGEDRSPRDFRPEPSEFAPRDDADDDADEADDESADDRELRVGHRAIPTWEEAVGLIVAKNMESRAKRPNGGQARGNRDRRGGPRRPSRGR